MNQKNGGSERGVRSNQDRDTLELIDSLRAAYREIYCLEDKIESLEKKITHITITCSLRDCRMTQE